MMARDSVRTRSPSTSVGTAPFRIEGEVLLGTLVLALGAGSRASSLRASSRARRRSGARGGRWETSGIHVEPHGVSSGLLDDAARRWLALRRRHPGQSAQRSREDPHCTARVARRNGPRGSPRANTCRCSQRQQWSPCAATARVPRAIELPSTRDPAPRRWRDRRTHGPWGRDSGSTQRRAMLASEPSLRDARCRRRASRSSAATPQQPGRYATMGYPAVMDPNLVGTFPALAKSGGGYVWDEVLEYRVWCHPEQGAPDEDDGDDYFYAFASYEEAAAVLARYRRCRAAARARLATRAYRRAGARAVRAREGRARHRMAGGVSRASATGREDHPEFLDPRPLQNRFDVLRATAPRRPPS